MNLYVLFSCLHPSCTSMKIVILLACTILVVARPKRDESQQQLSPKPQQQPIAANLKKHDIAYKYFSSLDSKQTPLYYCNEAIASNLLYRLPNSLTCEYLKLNIPNRVVPITLWYDTPALQSTTAYLCRATSTFAYTDVQFFGSYAENEKTTDKYVSESVCRDIIKTKVSPDGDKLEQIAPTAWTTKNEVTIGFNWLRRNEQTITNYMLSIITITRSNVDDTVITTVPLSHTCPFDQGNCRGQDQSILLWDQDLATTCRLTKGASTLCLYSESDERLTCPELTLAMTGIIPTEICDITLFTSQQGLLYTTDIVDDIGNLTATTSMVDRLTRVKIHVVTKRQIPIFNEPEIAKDAEKKLPSGPIPKSTHDEILPTPQIPNFMGEEYIQPQDDSKIPPFNRAEFPHQIPSIGPIPTFREEDLFEKHPDDISYDEFHLRAYPHRQKPMLPSKPIPSLTTTTTEANHLLTVLTPRTTMPLHPPSIPPFDEFDEFHLQPPLHVDAHHSTIRPILTPPNNQPNLTHLPMKQLPKTLSFEEFLQQYASVHSNNGFGKKYEQIPMPAKPNQPNRTMTVEITHQFQSKSNKSERVSYHGTPSDVVYSLLPKSSRRDSHIFTSDDVNARLQYLYSIIQHNLTSALQEVHHSTCINQKQILDLLITMAEQRQANFITRVLLPNDRYIVQNRGDALELKQCLPVHSYHFKERNQVNCTRNIPVSFVLNHLPYNGYMNEMSHQIVDQPENIECQHQTPFYFNTVDDGLILLTNTSTSFDVPYLPTADQFHKKFLPLSDEIFQTKGTLTARQLASQDTLLGLIQGIQNPVTIDNIIKSKRDGKSLSSDQEFLAQALTDFTTTPIQTLFWQIFALTLFIIAVIILAKLCWAFRVVLTTLCCTCTAIYKLCSRLKRAKNIPRSSSYTEMQRLRQLPPEYDSTIFGTTIIDPVTNRQTTVLINEIEQPKPSTSSQKLLPSAPIQENDQDLTNVCSHCMQSTSHHQSFGQQLLNHNIPTA